MLRTSPAPAAALQEAVLTDITEVGESTALFTDVQPMTVQSLLQHALVQVISEGVINSLIVTSSAEENLGFTRVHERLLTRTFHSHPLKRNSDAPTPLKPTTLILRPSLVPVGCVLVGLSQGMRLPLRSGVATRSLSRWNFSPLR